MTTTPLAVVGISCRLPGGNTPDEWWRTLVSGNEAVRDTSGMTPFDRWRSGAARAGLIDDVRGFDAAFFGISPREARLMDPQQRVVMELAWELLEDARIVPESVRGERFGVYLGAMNSDYLQLAASMSTEPQRHSLAGSVRGLLANRVSHHLGLTGTSVVVDTGQSSSLTALYAGARAVASGMEDLALVGGVNLILWPQGTAAAAAFGALSADGRCRTFDARADGYVRGEGAALVAVKRLEDALADGDRVYCLVAGAATSNDGADTDLTVPSRAGQEDAIRRAHDAAEIGPEDVDFIELHGTGTAVGDRVEAAALGARLGRRRARPLPVGSVKTVIGHLEGAAGIAGFVAAALSVHHRTLTPTLNFTEPNPDADLPGNNLHVQTEVLRLPADRDVVGGVSSFGMGGSNVHVVLRSAPPTPRRSAVVADTGAGLLGPRPVVVTGRDRAAVRRQAAALSRHLTADPGATPSLAEISASTFTTRAMLPARAVISVGSVGDLVEELDAVAAGDAGPRSRVWSATPGGIAVQFAGQGSQRPGAGRGLHRGDPLFAADVDRICARFAPLLGTDLRSVMFADANAEALRRTDVAQAAIVTLQLAQAAVLRRLGVRIEHVVGHSIGEYAAAVVAGVLSEDDAITLVAARGRLMASAPGRGAMASVRADGPTTEDLIATSGIDGVEIAAYNSAHQTVVSGPTDRLEDFVTAVTAGGTQVTRLAVDHAFHSAAMDPVVDAFATEASRVAFAAPRIAFTSTVFGRRVSAAEITAPEYWSTQIRRPVRYLQAVESLRADGVRTFVELGPQAVLSANVETIVPDCTAVSITRRDVPEDRTLAETVGVLGAAGALDPAAAFGPVGAVDLPRHSFAHQDFWLTEGDSAEGTTRAAPPAPTPPRVPEHDDTAVATRADGSDRVDVDGAVLRATAGVLGLDSVAEVDRRTPFRSAGMDSLGIVELVSRLRGIVDHPITPATVFDHPTPDSLIAHLAKGHRDEAVPVAVAARADDDPIVIVGMACRLPGGVQSVDDLWAVLEQGRDVIGDFPGDRGWDLDGLFDDDPSRPRTTYARQGGFLEAAGDFDPAFFGLSVREATAMDPQQRLLLEVAWEAMESAGVSRDVLRSASTGVYVGAMAQPYGPPMDHADVDVEGYLLTGVSPSVLSGRIAYVLGTNGPALTIDTACSSSLVATHLAARSIREGTCTFAFAGGVTVMPTPGIFVELSRQQALSPSGRCRAFSADADGTGWGEGAGLVLLTRMSVARDRDLPVLAVYEGSATNQDGASNGLTAPSGTAQREVIMSALADAGLSPHDVDLVEAHGTGTRLGDPIEATAILSTYGASRDGRGPVGLGSLKSNVGHSQAAAGVVGLIKTVLSMHHGVMPQTLHVGDLSPHVDWTAGEVEVLRMARHWPGDPMRPRRAAVSSFGISGTNAHAIVAEPPAAAAAHTDEPIDDDTMLLVSAGDESALRTRCRDVADVVRSGAVELGDLATAADRGRTRLAHRAVVVASTAAEAVDALDAVAAARPSTTAVVGRAEARRTALVFPGQGCHWDGMASDLMGSDPVFAARMREIDAVIEPLTGWAPSSVVARAPGAPALRSIAVVQPTLFATNVALAASWIARGLAPTAVVGHSQGEVAAAHVAGALDLADAARVIVVRSRVSLRTDGGGGLLAVLAERVVVETMITTHAVALDVAAVNADASTTVAGTVDELDRFADLLTAAGIENRRVAGVNMAGHSRQCDVLRDELLEGLRGIRPRAGTIPLYSSVTGEVLATEDMDPDYWFRNLRETVDFRGAVRRMIADGVTATVESSPHPVLASAVAANAESMGARVATLGTLRRDDGGRRRLLLAVGEAVAAGVEVRLDTPARRRVADVYARMPQYPFTRRSLWLDPGPVGAVEFAEFGFEVPSSALLGAGTTVPAARGALFTARPTRAEHPWIGDLSIASLALTTPGLLVELAVEAGDAVGLSQLRGLRIHSHIPVDDGYAMQVAVSAITEATAHVDIHARPVGVPGDSEWIHLASGDLAAAASVGDSVSPAPVAWPPAAEQIAVDTVLAALDEHGIDLGDTGESLLQVWSGEGAVHAVVQVPDTGAGPLVLHPTLVNVASLLGASLFDVEDGFVTVESIGGLMVLAEHPTSVRLSVTRRDDTLRLRMDDAAGKPVITETSMTIRALRAAEVEGTAVALAVARRRSTESLYVVGLHPREPEAVDDRPMHVAIVAPMTDGDPSLRVRRTLTHVVEVLRTHLSDDDGSGVLVLVTRGALAAGTTPPDPDLGAVWGLVRSAQAENPGSFVLVDTDGSVDDETISAFARSGHPQIVVRAGTMAVPRLDRLPERDGSDRTSVPIAPDGAVLVTGGTGTLGAMLARHLVRRHGVRHVVLTSRRGTAAAGAAEVVAELSDLGATVSVVALDVADADAVRSLFEGHEVPIRGVVHAAGVLDDATLGTMGARQLDAVLRPKADGLRVLDQVSRDHDVTLFVAYSSMVASFGNAGQANYAAANAYVESVVARRVAEGLPGVAIGWGLWDERSGMSAHLTTTDQARLTRWGIRGLSEAVGLDMFDTIVAGSPPVVVAVPVDSTTPVDFSADPGISPLLRSVVPAARRRTATATAHGSALHRRLARTLPAQWPRVTLDVVTEVAAGVLALDDPTAVRPEQAFKDMGFDSLMSVELRNRLSAEAGVRLPTTIVFDHPTPARLSQALLVRAADELSTGMPAPRSVDDPGRRGVTSTDDDPVVLIALACRLPGDVRTPDALWDMIVERRSGIGGFPTDRGWPEDLYDPDPGASGKSYSRHGGFLYDAAMFDADFFGMSPREALATDPQHRIMLETAWEAIERAGVDPHSLRGRDVGVFLGSVGQDYLGASDTAPAESEGFAVTGRASSVLSGRIAYALDLGGPAVTIDTACSSSLVALHLATRSIRSGECELAIVGGVSVMADPGLFVEFSRQRGMARDGRCKSFADGADGTVWAEGAVVVLAERRSTALAAGHRILAEISGSAINSDGASNGLTAPSGPAQQRVIRSALADAGLTAEDIDLVESHGTGTTLGDPIEAQALIETYGAARTPEDPLHVGALKTNTGHTQGAAGLAGVVKTVLALQHSLMPPSLHAESPTTAVEWDSVALLDRARPWPASTRRRRAGVSAFGISGTNAHVIISEPMPRPVTPRDVPTPVVTATPWPVSAATAAALPAQMDGLRAAFAHADHDRRAAVGAALASTRADLRHRAVDLDGGTDPDDLVVGRARDGDTVFVYTGQGGQWTDMGATLLEASPVFADALGEVAEIVDPLLAASLLDTIRGGDLVDTANAQPAIFAIQIALTRTLAAMGVTPDRVIGHSIGEVTAAHVAGVLSLADAARMIVARGAVMSAAPGDGAMAAVAAPESWVEEIVGTAGLVDRVAVAAVNGPTAVTVSGDVEAVEAVIAQASAAGCRTTRLAVSHAFHSPHMSCVTEEFAESIASMRFASPRIPIVSTVPSVHPVDTHRHWVDHVVAPVRFADAVTASGDAGRWLVVGPDAGLCGAIASCLPDGAVVASTMRRDSGTVTDLLRGVATVWASGGAVDWLTLYTGLDPRAVTLPTYAFDRRHYWIDRPRSRRGPSDSGDAEFWALVDEVRSDGGTSALGAALGLDDDATLTEIVPALSDWRRRTGTNGGRSPSIGVWSAVSVPAVLEETSAHGDLWVAVGDDTDVPTALRTAAERAGRSLHALLPGETPHTDGGAPTVLALYGFGAQDPTSVIARTADLVRKLDAVPGARLVVVTADPTQPCRSALAGAVRTAALERPTTVDAIADIGSTDDPDAWGRLLDVVGDGGALHRSGELEFTLSDDGVTVRRLRPLPLSTGADTPSLSGTVLVTGGTGGLGSAIAVWAARCGAERVVLTSRRGPEAPGVDAVVDAVRTAGAEVVVTALDCADAQIMRRTLREIEASGPVSSVFHAAGVVEFRPLADVDTDHLDRVVAGKTTGADVLDEYFADRDLDAFVLFSSIAATWGSSGQYAYSAANGHLDGVALRRAARGLAAMAVAWGPWDEVGMVRGVGVREMLHRNGLRPMRIQDATATLGALLSAARARPDRAVVTPVVADVDWGAFRRAYEWDRPRPLLAELPGGDTDLPTGVDERHGADRAGELRALPGDERLAELTAIVTTEVGVVLGSGGGDRPDPTRAFRDMGFDSMMTVELRDRLQSATGVAVTAVDIFDHPTPAELAAHCANALGDSSRAQVLSSLADIEADVDRLGPDDPALTDVVGRLRALLSRIDPSRSGPGPLTAPDRSGSGRRDGLGTLADADAADVFAFLDEMD